MAKISDTYNRYIVVRLEIDALTRNLKPGAKDKREKIGELSRLCDEHDALAAELREYLKPFADMARELGAMDVRICQDLFASFGKANPRYSVELSGDIKFNF